MDSSLPSLSAEPPSSRHDADQGNVRRRFMFVVAASVLLHAMLLIASLHRPFETGGGGAVELETVSVTLVTDRDISVARPAAAGSEPSVIQPSSDSIPPPREQFPPLAIEADDDAASAMDRAQTPRAAEVEPRREEPMAVATADALDLASDVSASTTVPLLSQAPLSTSDATADDAVASRGEIEQHARAVALVLARHRPKGIGAKGRVVVEFKLSADDGTLRDVRVAISSGIARLDRSAITAVEHGRYPIPPKGMRPEQLTFRIPFQFD